MRYHGEASKNLQNALNIKYCTHSTYLHAHIPKMNSSYVKICESSCLLLARISPASRPESLNCYPGVAGKLNFLKKMYFLFDCFWIFWTDFLPDFLTHKFGVTFSHFFTLPKVWVTFPKCGKSVRKCDEVYIAYVGVVNCRKVTHRDKVTGKCDCKFIAKGPFKTPW